jgi:DNA-binding Lrp family transcriptional regulator
MIRAYVLIQARVGESGNVVEGVARIPGVSSAEPVTGPYDVIAVVQVDELDDLRGLILAPIQSVPGVTRTVTCPVLGT